MEHPDADLYARAVATENQWMEALLSTDGRELTEKDYVSWGAYHASCQDQNVDRTQGISSLLPLFHENSKSPAIIKHAMDLVKNAVTFLNPG